MTPALGGQHSGGLSWVFDINRATGNYKRHDLPISDHKRAAEVGQMLWDANLESVRHRYTDCKGNDLPGPIGEDFEYSEHKPGFFGTAIDPVAVLKACDGFEYQACEHDGWPASEAKAFIDNLRSRAWTSLPGYDEAAWAVA